MTTTAIIISDAWASAYSHDINDYPTLEQEIRLYSEYLNFVMRHERSKGTTIVHAPGSRNIIDCIETSNDIVLGNLSIIPDHFDRYLICGFHYGRCIYDKLNQLSKIKKIQGKEIGAIINLSHWLFRDTVQGTAAQMAKYNNYIWTPKEITKVNISL